MEMSKTGHLGPASFISYEKQEDEWILLTI